MSKEEMDTYTEFVRTNLVKPEQPGSVIARLALHAESSLRGEILFWNDAKFESYMK